MSLTVTLLTGTAPQVQAAPNHLAVLLRGSLAPSVATLLQKIRADIMTLPENRKEEVRQAIDDWESAFFEEYQIDSPLDANREDASHALLFLRLNSIQYVMLNYAENQTQKLKWLMHYNEIEKIVSSILPPHVNVKAFIESDTKKQSEDRLRYRVAQAIDEVLPKIAEDYAGLENRLYEKVDRINEEMQREFEERKNSLTQLMMDRRVSIGEIHGELQRHTDQVERIYMELKMQLQEMRDRGKGIEMIKKALAHHLDACEAVINKV